MPQTNTAKRNRVSVKTTDATQTVLTTFPTRTDKGYTAKVEITAIATDAFDEVASYGYVATFKNDGGTLTQVGSTRELFPPNESVGAWSVAIDANGTDIRVRVTGAASTEITWEADMDVHEVG